MEAGARQACADAPVIARPPRQNGISARGSMEKVRRSGSAVEKPIAMGYLAS